MSVSFKKATEKLAKASAQRLRAVTPAEAPHVAPARTSTTQSLEPWKHWMQSFLKDNMKTTHYQTFRELTNFMPDDIYDLQQSPKPNQKIPISKTDPNITHMYRHPAPGSQKPVRLPEFADDEDPYDTGYFKRDTRRRYLNSELGDEGVEAAKLRLMNPEDVDVQEEVAKLEAGPASSPGNKGKFATGPSDFDPTGLRATMSVSWESLEKSLDDHMPDHLPTPTWEGNEEEVINYYEERDVPVPVGDYYEAMKVPRELRVATW
jgi:hypothetical protein